MNIDIKNPLSSIVDVAKTVLERVLPDKAAKDAATAQLAEMALNGELQQVAGQLEINKIEAASTNWFVAGARPAAMWICDIGLFYAIFLQPVGTWIAMLCGKQVTAPHLDTQLLLAILLPLLGIGVLRTVDKVNGVDTKGN